MKHKCIHDALLAAEVGDLKAEIKRIKAVNERLRRNLEASREAHADTKEAHGRFHFALSDFALAGQFGEVIDLLDEVDR